MHDTYQNHLHHQCYHISEYFRQSQDNSCCHQQPSPMIPSPYPCKLICYFYVSIYWFFDLPINEFTWHAIFCEWILLCSMLSEAFHWAALTLCHSFFFVFIMNVQFLVEELDNTPLLEHNKLYSLSLDGHWIVSTFGVFSKVCYVLSCSGILAILSFCLGMNVESQLSSHGHIVLKQGCFIVLSVSCKNYFCILIKDLIYIELTHSLFHCMNHFILLCQLKYKGL